MSLVEQTQMKYGLVVILLLTNTAIAGSDTKVFIDQIADQSTIVIDQIGTVNNYLNYSSVGTENNLTVSQAGSNNNQTNHASVTVTGNQNSVSINQGFRTDTATSQKGVLVNIAGNSNSATVIQKDSGGHYAEVSLFDNNKSVEIVQEGAGSHTANVTLSGQPNSLNLIQSGNTQQYFSINSNCGTAGGCAAIQVIQGR